MADPIIDGINDPVSSWRRRKNSIEEHADSIGVFPCLPDSAEVPGPVIFYRPDEVLTTDPAGVLQTVELVNGIRPGRIGLEPIAEYRPEKAESDPGVTTFRVFGDPALDAVELAHVLRHYRPDLPVAPHHLLTPGQRVGGNAPPLPPFADRAKPAAAVRSRLGVGWRAGLVDTGMIETSDVQAMAAAGGLRYRVPQDVETPDVDGDGVIDFESTGHGTFISSQLWRSGLDVDVVRVVVDPPMGDAFAEEMSIVRAVDSIGADPDVKLIVICMGTYELVDLPLVGLRAAARRWAADPAFADRLVVCAAGNGTRSDRWFPAGFSADHWTGDLFVAVGSADFARPAVEGVDCAKASEPFDPWRIAPSDFSNFGTWVNAWANGVDVHSHYAEALDYRYDLPDGSADTQPFDGWARWSGTSFAAPRAASRIAEHAAAQGLDPRAAWRSMALGRPWVLFPPKAR
ncbi:MAG: S8 family serine peptidase [Acidimicrobiia bacterium]|nr:S8 family serine peptidase [Acidimicrobiia bacterium]MDH4307050.1 S8 family serine peptidase [Acidimicrobiia bacterium]MDH5293222.1 S8 family serine peptidase [Acidimicrobiia bacterium]